MSPFEDQKDDYEGTHVVLDENNIKTNSNEVHDNSKEEVTNDSKIGKCTTSMSRFCT